MGGEQALGRAAALAFVGVLALVVTAGAGHSSERPAGSASPSSIRAAVPPDEGLPTPVESPPVDPAAPYTPMVRSLIDQLLPSDPPTLDQIRNAARLFDGHDTRPFGDAGLGACHTVGQVDAPTGTDPSIAPMCWADSVGIDVTGGPNVGRTTAPPQPLALAASFDTLLNNAWGQVEAAEGRQLMVTGLYGPQVDVTVHPNWQRGLDTLGEDPLLTSRLAAAQVHGMQGRGLMAQVKHLAGFSAADRYGLTELQDQALHEIVFPPFEATLVGAGAASTMCAYNGLHDVSEHLPGTRPVLFLPSPFGRDASTTWPLDEAHYTCEQPLTLSYALRTLWKSVAFVGSDFPATYSVAAASQGLTQEFPFAAFLGANDPSPDLPRGAIAGDPSDPSGNTCALGDQRVPCATAGSVRTGGIPGPGCPQPNGCGLVNAVHRGVFPLVVFKQMMALVLYQQERFGLLGCDQTPVAATCTNPGGVAGDRSGAASLPATATEGADTVGTREGDAAIVQRAAEEGAVLLRNRSGGLPIDPRDLAGGIAVSGAGADHLVAAPSKETAVGFTDRNLISPLDRLRELSGDPTAISFTPANSPTGITVPSAALVPVDGAGTGLTRTEGPDSPSVDPVIDFTEGSPAGRLAPGSYRWDGALRVADADRHTFRVQMSSGADAALVVDGAEQQLRPATSSYCGQYYARLVCLPADRTRSGTTEAGLVNLEALPLDLGPGDHRVELRVTVRSSAPASVRFAYSRDLGDANDAATTARGRAMAIVFVDDNGVTTAGQSDRTPPSVEVPTLPERQVRLIEAVAAANPRTVVVLNTAGPVVTAPWIDNPHVVSVLEMWNAGGEGGTATARVLLGLAEPGGRTPITWPRGATDTIWAYDQPRALYPGDERGAHPERLNGASEADRSHCKPLVDDPTPCTKTVMTQGIFSGYRYHDQLGLEPQFPFGFGLGYTSFRYDGLTADWRRGRLIVGLDVTNTGRRRGTAVPQVYLGPSSGAPDSVQQAPKSLAGFERVTLEPGATQHVEIEVAARSLQYWDEVDQSWRTPSGRRTVLAGEPSTATELPLRTAITVGAAAESSQSSVAGDGRGSTVPWVLGGLGAVALVATVVAVRRRRRS